MILIQTVENEKLEGISQAIQQYYKLEKQRILFWQSCSRRRPLLLSSHNLILYAGFQTWTSYSIMYYLNTGRLRYNSFSVVCHTSTSWLNGPNLPNLSQHQEFYRLSSKKKWCTLLVSNCGYVRPSESTTHKSVFCRGSIRGVHHNGELGDRHGLKSFVQLNIGRARARWHLLQEEKHQTSKPKTLLWAPLDWLGVQERDL